MSEIASCSYEARAHGVRNGCFIKDARKACPDLICLPYQFDDYRHISKEIYSILSGLVAESVILVMFILACLMLKQVFESFEDIFSLLRGVENLYSIN